MVLVPLKVVQVQVVLTYENEGMLSRVIGPMHTLQS